MGPDLEVIQIRPGESFTVFSHGYPYRTVRWHFHPEYELHLIVGTSGQYFVGDYIGRFQPGNLVLTGPNLPHNWVSEIPEGSNVAERCQLIQFGETFIGDAVRIMPELSGIEPILNLSRRGALFDEQTSLEVVPLMREVMSASGVRRLELFIQMLGHLSRAKNVRPLASAGYLPDPSGYMSAGINKALAHVREHLTQAFAESDLAKIAGQTTPGFSRAFRRHTGMSLVQYVKRLRVNFACQLLMTDEQLSVTEICFQSGFNNLSNFNRQFLAEKGMTPSSFRRMHLDNAAASNKAA
ncbi:MULTISPECIES: helix-turn-helix domain-containing protein [Agrobacterium]|uniref:AraC family transcriptional regulator n=1 Tax=Agrobacterium rubi TaxID=28099 RepID=A0AAE7R8Y1_9HYPH|nr:MULTISPECIES: helix-turn-helix domain-containing protein [Agrobacterium]MBN7808889.1 helix-turn-helix domain-containing protein [Agrobacterium rosae]NTE90179.1 AraC family transcriptional regulator [Agrobacterium rubi]NTF05998.1 AraC family transcriptional regulator [Agrobacterium rubi]NTF40237.1 AraC family transcriptional regulator [Agrobacterium rubi]OCJ53028.1 AraC family transcriptional regulator [Agrobacterium rubi]